MMEWIVDPAAWLGLLTLVILEIVLGIDNLIFIAILAEKLPPHLRDRARQLGLSIALLMRLVLLASMSWLMTLTEPLVSLFGKSFSGRDLILLGGGLFLLFKATMELHERLEGRSHEHQGTRVQASFWTVVVQIIVLDAVFSLDAVITAVGMVEHLSVMMTAVVIAMLMMIVASKPLSSFVNRHPTVVMLCLGFLLMIGFTLTAEGLGFHIPKGYLYGAIAFSILIEVFNQWARYNRTKQITKAAPLRARTAEAVLKLLGGRPDPMEMGEGVAAMAAGSENEPVFDENERSMIRSVLSLAERPIQSLMTPRPDIVWIDVEDADSKLLDILGEHQHSRLIVSRGELDEMIGVVQSRDLLVSLLAKKPLDLVSQAVEPLIVPEGTSALKVLEGLRQHRVPMAVVVDEYGSIEGVVTTSDLLAAIAGELADTVDSDAPQVQKQDDGSYLLDGALPLDELEQLLGIRVQTDDYYTLAGLALAQLQAVPKVGDSFELEDYRFTIKSMAARRILQVEVSPLPQEEQAMALRERSLA